MGWVRRWHQGLEGMDGGWRALRGSAVTTHASFNGIAPAPVLRLSAAGMEEPAGAPAGVRVREDGGPDPPGSKEKARGGPLHHEDKASRTR